MESTGLSWGEGEMNELITNYELRITNYKLRLGDWTMNELITNFKLRITNYETKPWVSERRERRPGIKKGASTNIF